MTRRTWPCTWPRLHAGPHTWAYDRPTKRTTEPARLRPGSRRSTKGLYRYIAFSVATGVVGFHVATWSIVSRHRSSTTGAAVLRQGSQASWES